MADINVKKVDESTPLMETKATPPASNAPVLLTAVSSASKLKSKGDPKINLRNTQLKRAEEVVITFKDDLAYNTSMSKALWYLCHFFAFVGWGSGMSIAGTSIGNNRMPDFVIALLGCLTALYPFTKYLDLEGKRTRSNNLVMFCNKLITKLDDTLSTMRDLRDAMNLDYNDQMEVDWTDLIDFVNKAKESISKIEIGVEDIQTVMSDYSKVEQKAANKIIQQIANRAR